MARKPIPSTVADNVLTHGVGGINIDECRLEANAEKLTRDLYDNPSWKNSSINGQGSVNDIADRLGRFPANVIHDGSEEVVQGFPDTVSGGYQNGSRMNKGNKWRKIVETTWCIMSK
jgi:hypothetical protein